MHKRNPHIYILVPRVSLSRDLPKSMLQTLQSHETFFPNALLEFAEDTIEYYANHTPMILWKRLIPIKRIFNPGHAKASLQQRIFLKKLLIVINRLLGRKLSLHIVKTRFAFVISFDHTNKLDIDPSRQKRRNIALRLSLQISLATYILSKQKTTPILQITPFKITAN